MYLQKAEIKLQVVLIVGLLRLVIFSMAGVLFMGHCSLTVVEIHCLHLAVLVVLALETFAHQTKMSGGRDKVQKDLLN